MKTSSPVLSTRRRRGQVMVLSCVALFVMALMLMLSFSLSNAIHERIRIQSHADATAFSAATVSARALNVTAYINRAIAASVVSSMSVHAWMTIASMTISILETGQQNFIFMALAELALCCTCSPPVVCCKIDHCEHAWDDYDVSDEYGDKADDYRDKVEGLEGDFNKVIEKFNDANISLYKAQKDVMTRAMDEVSTEGNLLNALKAKNAPRSKYEMDLVSMNAKELACALEGHSKDGTCQKLVGSAPSVGDKAVRSAVMQNAVNAARISFLRDCSGCVMSMHSDLMPSGQLLLNDIQGGEILEFHSFSMESALGGSPGDTSPGADTEAKALGSTASGSMQTMKHCIPMTGSIDSKTWSDENGGEHEPGHDEDHDKFKGIEQAGDPCGGEDACFVNFRSSNDKEIDFNQPSMWAGVSQDIGIMRDGKHKVWEVNADARIRVKYGDGVETDVLIKPRGTAVAVAKAKVYYHQLKHWQYQPNLFDPFWRAKLHPFKKDELTKALELSGDAAGAEISSGGGPIEGGF